MVPRPSRAAPRVGPSSERRRRIVSGLVLLAVMAGHAMRETARDTLFLSALPASRLPWAYLAIAALALTLGSLTRALLARFSQRRLLAGTLALGCVVDLAFWASPADGVPAWLFAFYVWTGLLSTAVTMHFWLHLAEAFAVDEAKRSFAPIAAGGLIGAVAGSAAATLLLSVWATHSLLLGSSLLFGAAAFLPWLLPLRLEEEPATPEADAMPAPALTLGELIANRYLRRLLALAGLTAILATGIDFAFKSGAAQTIPRAELGRFFARFQTGVNCSALLLQLVLAPLLLRSFGVIRALAVLPGLVLAGSAASIVGSGFLPVALLRGVDGTLRHSLHRAGTEILYLPLEQSIRATFRTLAESMGHRGGQALASLAILLAVATHAGPHAMGVALLAVSGLALLCLVGMREEYVARFREQLRDLHGDPRNEAPRLDLHSLEVLVSCLSSANDAEVLSALDMLDAYDKTALVPPLILHHPSRAVVLRALEHFSRADHPHLDTFLERLASHAEPEVRAAALRVHAARAPSDPRILTVMRKDPSPRVRATALVIWLARRGDPAELQRLSREILADEDRLARLALARALPDLPYMAIKEPVEQLLADHDEAVVVELVEAAAANAGPERIPLLVALLARRAARGPARAALATLGEPALDALITALKSDATPDAVRRHLVRTISRFRGGRALAALVDALGGDDPRIRSQAAVGLGRLRDHDPTLPVPVEPLERAAGHALERAATMLCWGAIYAAWTERISPGFSRAGDSLRLLLEEEERRSLERVFRLLHVIEPEHGYGEIFRALRRGGVHGAGSREMVEHLVEGRLRDGILAMVGAASPLERLRDVLVFCEPVGAKQVLALAAEDGPATPSAGARAELDTLAEAFFASAEADLDPILASVARRNRRASAAASAEGGT